MHLKKNLKLLDLFCIASGAMISSGIFVLPGLAHSYAGTAAALSYLIAGVIAALGMLSEAELSSAMPKAGGSYFFITRSMGPGMGSIGGILSWFSLCLKTSFSLVGMAAFVAVFIALDMRLVGVALCVIFFFINLVGVKEASRIQIIVVGILLLILLGYIIGGFAVCDFTKINTFAPNGIMPIFTTAGFVFVSYGGILHVSSVSEEVINPGKIIPIGMILSIIIVTAIYVLVVLLTSYIVPSNILNNSLMPISDGGYQIWGRGGFLILTIGAILAFVSTANAGIMASSRYPLALGRDKLFPHIFTHISHKFKTPDFSLLCTALLILASLFLDLTVLVKAASTVLLVTFILSALCVIVLRESKIQNYQPNFKSPFYPWVQILGILSCIFLIIDMGITAIVICAIMILAATMIYLLYGKKRVNKEYALLHLIERITNKELTSRLLEDELREILLERDEVIGDRFDKTIRDSLIFDIEKQMTMSDFFALISHSISYKLEISYNEIFNKLVNREKESSTVISSEVAIPHIVIESEKKFTILIARIKNGIIFNPESLINTVFVLIGTKDERNFHLRALSAIAQIVQENSFKKNWNSAKSAEELRDIILLAERNRN